MLSLWLWLLFQAGPANFLIGPDDVLDVQVFQSPDLNRTVRVDQTGNITLPLLGTVKAAGSSPSELERQLAKLYGEKYLNNPSVSVFVREFKSNPVSIVGAVKAPGLYTIPSSKTLTEVIAMAQGFADNPNAKAGSRVLVTHEGKTQEFNVLEILHNQERAAQALVYPGDQVRVLPADIVYVLGDVEKPGGYALETHQDVTVLQALALAGGPKRTAKLKEVVIFRKDNEGNRSELPIRLTNKLTGPGADRLLEANDILFVPGSVSKRAFTRALDLSLATASGVVIWRR